MKTLSLIQVLCIHTCATQFGMLTKAQRYLVLSTLRHAKHESVEVKSREAESVGVHACGCEPRSVFCYGLMSR